MHIFLTIPWFRLEPWNIPLPSFLPFEHLPIQPFGVLVAIGVLLGARLCEEYCKRRGIEPTIAADFLTHTILIGFVGAYLLNGIVYETETFLAVLQDPTLLFKRWLGLSSYGGMVGALAGMLIWKKRTGHPIMPLADAAAFGFPLGWMFGRMGCFVVHDHPGIETDFFLGVEEYRFGAPPFVTRHDLGLYEVIWAACIVALFFFLYSRNRERPLGTWLALLSILYAPIRFGLDFLRASSELGGDVRFLGLTPAQYASFICLAFGLYMIKRGKEIPTFVVPKSMALRVVDATPSDDSSSEPKKKSKKKKN